MNFIGKKVFTKRNASLIHCDYYVPKHIDHDLTVLRHAQSFYNVASEKYIKQNHLAHLGWDDICQIADFNLDINYNSKFIDSDLSEKGVIQCFNLREELLAERMQIDLILCSPLLRGLRTCRHVFDRLKIKKVVVPELTEVLRYACDISSDIEEKKEEFSELDWSLFPENDNFWLLKTQPKKISQKIQEMLKEKQPVTYKETQYELLMMLYQQKIFESDRDLRMRAKRVKQIIRAFRAQYKHIVVISHHYLLQHLIAQGYRQDSQPITSIIDEVPNATPIGLSVGEVLSVM